VVVSGTSTVTGYCQNVFISAAPGQVISAVREHLMSVWVGVLPSGAPPVLFVQLDEGETQVVNIRETDGRLGPLVFTLVALGCTSLVATIGFWWLTRVPRQVSDEAEQAQIEGER
jgi:hypothetical protein